MWRGGTQGESEQRVWGLEKNEVHYAEIFITKVV
jgi:hypothetical protein